MTVATSALRESGLVEPVAFVLFIGFWTFMLIAIIVLELRKSMRI